MRFFLIIIFIFFSITAYGVERYEGVIDKSRYTLNLELKNFDGYLIQNKINFDGNNSFKVSIKNNIFRHSFGISKDGSFVPYISDLGGAIIEVDIKNNSKITKAVMKEGNKDWVDIRNEKMPGSDLSFAELFMNASEFDQRVYELDIPVNDSFGKLFRALGFNSSDLPFGNSKATTYYRGTTCYNDRLSALLEHEVDNKYSGYSLYDLESGLSHGGKIEMNFNEISLSEDYSQSYFVDAISNCFSTSVNKSNNNDNSAIKNKLEELKELLDSGLISEQQYEDKSSKMLENF